MIDPEMEKRLIDWYNEIKFECKKNVTSKMIKARAKLWSKCPKFNASKGWLEKFKRKYNLIIDRRESPQP